MLISMDRNSVKICDTTIESDLYCSNEVIVKLLEDQNLREAVLDEFKKDKLTVRSLGENNSGVYKDNIVNYIEFSDSCKIKGYYAKCSQEELC